MKVCLVNSAPGWGGGERMFLELALGFRQAGHSVTVVCRPGSVLGARLAGKVDVQLMRCRGDFDLTTAWALRRLFKEQRIDAVLCNMGRDCVLAGVAGLTRRTPVARIRAMAHTRRSLRNLLIYRGLLTAVVSVSAAVQAGLSDLHIPAPRRYVIPNGIDVVPPASDRAALRAAWNVAPGDFLVAYTGRLITEKGVDLLPPMVKHLVEAAAPVRLLVAGDGPLRAALEQQCNTPELRGRIAFLGFLEEPLRLLAAADAAVMPSRTEAFPVAALEALAVGTPLVASCVGGLAEIATDDSAILVPAEDPLALAQALLRISREPELAARLRVRGPARAQMFSRRRMIEQYEGLIRQLRGAPGAAPPGGSA